jgi:hypothetical protein
LSCCFTNCFKIAFPLEAHPHIGICCFGAKIAVYDAKRRNYFTEDCDGFTENNFTENNFTENKKDGQMS